MFRTLFVSMHVQDHWFYDETIQRTVVVTTFKFKAWMIEYESIWFANFQTFIHESWASIILGITYMWRFFKKRVIQKITSVTTTRLACCWWNISPAREHAIKKPGVFVCYLHDLNYEFCLWMFHVFGSCFCKWLCVNFIWVNVPF